MTTTPLDEALAPLVDQPLDAEVLLRVRLAVIRDDLDTFDRALHLRRRGTTRRAAATAITRLSREETRTLRELDELATGHLDITWSSS